jgi:glutamine amidotransferase
MNREVAIVDYGGGNVQSVAFALDRLGATSVLTADPDVVASASYVIFPGQGRADRAMAALRERGLDAALLSRSLPTLGICIGQQLMGAHSEEGDTTALGVFAERCVKFGEIEGLKVPHMGWNTVSEVRGSLFDVADEGAYFYFVHSYYLQLGPHSTATCHYGGGFSAATERDNFFAVQFHPEKSGAAGERLLRRFLTL